MLVGLSSEHTGDVYGSCTGVPCSSSVGDEGCFDVLFHRFCLGTFGGALKVGVVAAGVSPSVPRESAFTSSALRTSLESPPAILRPLVSLSRFMEPGGVPCTGLSLEYNSCPFHLIMLITHFHDKSRSPKTANDSVWSN